MSAWGPRAHSLTPYPKYLSRAYPPKLDVFLPPPMNVTPCSAALGAPLLGGMVANAMYGALICQTTWYFRVFPEEGPYLKFLIGTLCVSQTAGLVLSANSLWYYFIQRGMGDHVQPLIDCNYWSAAAFFIPTEFTCFLAEIFFIKRLWSLANKMSNQKNLILAIVVLLPFIVGWGFTIYFLQGMQRYYCFPQRKATNFSLLVSFGLRIFSSGVVTGTMCFLLYQEASPLSSSPMVQTRRLLRVMKWLVMGSSSTGLLMWLTAIAFVATYIVFSDSPIPFGVYGVRGGFFANAVLVSLNDRKRYRRILTESIALHSPIEFPSTPRITPPLE